MRGVVGAWLLVAVGCGGDGVVGPDGSTLGLGTVTGGPGPVPGSTPPETASGIQIGEAGDVLPCAWVPVDDAGEIVASRAAAEAFAGATPGVRTRPSGALAPLDLEVVLGDAVVESLEPLGDTGLASCGRVRRVRWAATVSLAGEGIAESGGGAVYVDTSARLVLTVPLDAAQGQPVRMDPAELPPIAFVFEASGSPLSGTVGWYADDGGSWYYESWGTWAAE